MSKLPLSTNIGALTGDIYLRPLLPTPAARPYSAGFADSVTISVDVTSDPIYGVVDGDRVKIDSWVTEKGGTISITMHEMRADHVATALMATSKALTQTSATGATISATGVKAGEIVELGKLDVTSVSVTDGEDPLVADVDYVVKEKNGVVLFLTEQPEVEITFSAPAITADANRVLSSILTSTEGLVCEVIVNGRNKRGIRYNVRTRTALKPSGEFQVAGDGSSLSSITLTGDLKVNPDDPESPFGYIEQLS